VIRKLIGDGRLGHFRIGTLIRIPAEEVAALRMPEYTVQRFRGGYAIVYRDAAGTTTPRATTGQGPSWGGSGGTAGMGRRERPFIVDRGAHRASLHRRPRSRRDRLDRSPADAWKAMRPFWENVEPDLIDREMAQSYAKRRGMAAATIRYELGMLSVALRWAVEKELIRKAPTIWRPDPPERKVAT
jgi:hypothetical protein